MLASGRKEPTNAAKDDLPLLRCLPFASAKNAFNMTQLRKLNRRSSSSRRMQATAATESLESRLMLTPGFDFDYTVVSSNLSTNPAQRFYGSMNADDSPFTILRYGTGTVTSLTDFGSISSLISDPSDITFEFGVDDVDNPVEVVTLSTFIPGNPFDSINNPARQIYTPDGVNDDPTLTVFINGTEVATGQVTRVSLQTDINGNVISPASDPSTFKLTAPVGNDSTLFDAIIEATGGTGDVPFTLSPFFFEGPWLGVADAEIFSADGSSLLEIPPDDHANSLNQATPWNTASPATGLLEVSDDVDWFSTTLTAGTQYTFQLASGNSPASPQIDLFAPNEDFVMWGVTSEEGDTTDLTYTPTTTGTHYFKVQHGPVGSYSLSLESMLAVPTDDHGDTRQTATPWDRQAPVDGNIEVGGDPDWFAVQLTQGTEYTFQTNTGTLTDTMLELYDPDGNLLDENDDADVGGFFELYSEITFVAPTTDTYYLVVLGYEDSGDYEGDPLDPYLIQMVGTYSLEQTSEQVALPGVPTVAAVASPTTNQRPLFGWSTEANAQDYEVFISDVASPGTPIVRQFVSDTTFTPSVDLGIGTRQIWVRSRAASGLLSDWSAPQNFHITGQVVLDPMTFLSPTDSPTTTWNAIPGAVNYQVWVANTTLGIAEHTNTTVSGNSFTPSSAYSFGRNAIWVRAIDSRGVFAQWSAPVVFYIGPQPVAPLNPTFDLTPEFEWTAVPGAATYDVSIWQSGVGATTITGIMGTTYTPPSDLAAARSVWYVRPVAADSTVGRWTAPQEFYAGGRPTLLGPSGGITDVRPTFSWTPVDGAVRYELHVNQTGVTVAILETNLTTTSFTPASDLPAGTYRAWVRAIDAGSGATLWSVPLTSTY